MRIVRDSLVRRRTEFQNLKIEQSRSLQIAIDEEKATRDRFARGELLRREDLESIRLYRISLEKDISATESLINSLTTQLEKIPQTDHEDMVAAKEAALLEKFEEMRSDLLSEFLPKLRRAFMTFNMAGKCASWPEFLLNIMLLTPPSRDEWRKERENISE